MRIGRPGGVPSRPVRARQEWADFATQLRAEGKTKAEIARVLREEFGIGALAALRHAHGWSQSQAADMWSARWPDQIKTYKDFSAWETRRHTPPLEVFDRLAQLYQCDLVDVLADRRGYRHLDEAARGVGGRNTGRVPPAPWRERAGLRPVGKEIDGGESWRAAVQTADDLEVLVASYRRAYAGAARVSELLPVANGLHQLLTDLGRRGEWPGDTEGLASLIGQTAVLAGLLELMGHRDLDAARALYNRALEAAYDAEDWDLAAYALGSLAFEAMSAQRPADSRELRDTAWDIASQRATPRTRAWVAALASELWARDGHEAVSRNLLDEATKAMRQTRDEPSWKGVGWFDEVRLEAYEGGNLLLLGQYDDAVERLRRSLDRLEPDRLKHRCTLSADLALALVHLAEIDEACSRAGEALSLATTIAHRESVDRIRRVHTHMLRWKDHPGVRELTERLYAA